jgi:hypothetical protein
MEKKKRQPTIKMQKAAIALVGNGGNVTQAMLAAGYSEATANTPGKLTKSVGWQELLDTYLPDDMLLRALSDDIEKKEGNRTAELTLAVKMKGRLSEKVEHTNPDGNLKTIVINKYGSHDKPAS